MSGKGRGWHGDSRLHSLARKGVSTKIDENRRFAVNNFVARRNFPTPEQRLKAQKEQEAMIRRRMEVEDNYYNYLEEMMKKPDGERFLDKELINDKNINLGRWIQRFDKHFYENDIHLKIEYL